MFPYPTQSIPSEGSRPQPDAFPYYPRQSQDRQYAQPSQHLQQQPQSHQQTQPTQTQGTQSPYYQGQYATAAPYYYQMPLATTTDASQNSNPQDRYQSGIYGYGGGYATPSAPPTATAAGATAAGAPAPGSRPAATAYAPYYSNDFVVPMVYQQQSQQQPQVQSQQQQAQAQQQQGHAQTHQQHSGVPGSQVQSPYITAQRSMYGPGQAASAATSQFRGMQAPGPQTSQPQLAPMPMATGRAPTSQTPPTGHRATVSTHLSAIPASMPVTDPTGQTAPPGIKPRVTTTLWEDEGTTCFQVEARGYCVARREDNDMINGTKLLNVAGMTRGRRDGLLKGERSRHVVKAGAMHLKGVWIPYDRALDFANKERIVDLLYPLFVTDIKSVLYHPANPDLRHAGAGAASAGGAGSAGGVGPAQGGQPHQALPPQAHAQLQQHLPQGHPGAGGSQSAAAGGAGNASTPKSGNPSVSTAGSAAGGSNGSVGGPNGASQRTAAVPNATGGAPGPVVPVVPGGSGQPGAASHVSPVLPQTHIETQNSESAQGSANGNTQLPHLSSLGAVQSGMENQSLPQPYALGQAKPKSEIEEGNGQAHPSQHAQYGQQHPEKSEQYYGYDASQAASQAGSAQQQSGYYS